jgi:hypothetical protein
MKHNQHVIEEEDSFAELQESDLDLEAELKKIQMIEEEDIRKGKRSSKVEAGAKKNTNGEKSNRGK